MIGAVGYTTPNSQAWWMHLFGDEIKVTKHGSEIPIEKADYQQLSILHLKDQLESIMTANHYPS